MKRIITLILCIAVIAATGFTQDLKVHRKTGAIVTVPLEDVDSITFPTNIYPPGIPCPGTPTVTDIDGNEYNTVLINDQCWMKENLKTTKYRNGSDIEYPGSDNNAWTYNTSGAYAWYDNATLWGDFYGALYNWYAVDNSNGLCPAGWHVPSDAEWSNMIAYIQSINPTSVGNQLKSCRQINSPLGGICNTSTHPRWEEDYYDYGTDDYGFSALPGGYRNSNGSFNNLGYDGYWWSSTEHSSSTAWTRYMHCNTDDVHRYDDSKDYGFSVRCLKD